jgi:excinuclease UvrABC nuclease subunit
MPFENHGNRSFTTISIGKNAPTASGVYGLADASQWIYVGEAANIQADLLRHLQNPHSFLRKHPPSGFTYELSAEGQRSERQNQLVQELEPIGNRLVGDISNPASREKEY